MIADSIAPVRQRSGRAPAGMWWVAWRQHRFTLVVALGLVAALGLTMVVFRLVYGAVDPYPGPRFGGLNRFWLILRLSLIALPVGVGALAGAVVFGQDRERGTQVFALSQSVGRSRWYWTKCVVVAAPLTLAVLALGLIAQWVVTAPGLETRIPMQIPDFQLLGAVPAAFTLLSFGFGVPAGVFFRSLAAAMSLAFVAATVVTVTLGYGLYTDLVPPDRIVTPLRSEDFVEVPGLPLVGGYGYLDAAGNVVMPPVCSTGAVEVGTVAAETVRAQWQECMADAGIVSSYTEFIHDDQRGQLTSVLSGICAAIAAAGFTLGWLRVRRRVL